MSNHPSQLEKVISLAATLEYFHHGEECFATIIVNGHTENWPLKSRSFRHWLRLQYLLQEKDVLRNATLNDALGILEARALFQSPEQRVFTRIADRSGAIYLDLVNDKWNAVKITRKGWVVLRNPKVKFRRAKGMLPLPKPVKGGSIDELRKFVNITDKDWPLLVGWLVGALMAHGPYPLLILHGEHGSAKSTLARILRSLIDPNSAPLRSTPKEPRDLMISATNSWVQSFDNLSFVHSWLSDALCRLSTGGGFSTRQLYQDDEEKIFDAQRPVILNGIEELASRGDLLDRSIILYLPTIPRDRRETETELWDRFNKARPRIIGALFDAVRQALKNLSGVKLTDLPRMADFAKWVVAAEPALCWKAGNFMTAYSRNQEMTSQLPLEASPITDPLMKFIEKQPNTQWEGTSKQLLPLLNKERVISVADKWNWPQDPTRLAGALRRLAPSLRSVVNIQFGRKKTRLITMELVKKIVSPVPLSQMAAKSAAGDAGVAKIPVHSNGAESHEIL